MSRISNPKYVLLSEERQRMILEEEIRHKHQGITKATARRISAEELTPCDIIEKEQEQAPLETVSEGTPTASETTDMQKTESFGLETETLLNKGTGEILHELRGKQMQAFHQVKQVRKCTTPSTQAGYGSDDTDQSTDVADDTDDIEDDDEWDIPEGGAWDDEAAVIEEEEEMSSVSELITSQSADAIMSMERRQCIDGTIFTPKGSWDHRLGCTIKRLEKNVQESRSSRLVVGSTVVGSARCRKEAEIEEKMCGAALKAVKMLRRRSVGKLETLVEDWEAKKDGPTVKYSTKEQGVSIVPTGGYDWSKMDVQQRALVGENLKQFRLKQKREQRNAEEMAICTFVPKINKSLRSKDGTEIKSRVMSAIARRPSSCPRPCAPSVRNGGNSPRKQTQLARSNKRKHEIERR